MTGRSEKSKAEKLFGERESKDRFFLIPKNRGKNRILQNLFEGEDLQRIREQLGIPRNSSFEKTIAALHFAPEKANIMAKISDQTRRNFDELYASLRLAIA